MEIIDIVDDENNVVGQMERYQAHAEGKNFRVVSVMLEDDEGGVLMQRRSMNKSYAPGAYGMSAGGHVTSGEDLKVSARRELQEEIGVDAELTEMGSIVMKREGYLVFNTLYVGKYNGEEIKTCPVEVDSVEIWTVEKVKQNIKENPEIFKNGFPQQFEKYLQFKNL